MAKLRPLGTLALVLAAAACDGEIASHDLDPDAGLVATADAMPGAPDAKPAAPDASPDAGGLTTTGQTFELQNVNSAFPPPLPGLPNMIVYVPAGFDVSRPLQLVVYIHGHNNCIRNAIRETNGTCSPGGAVHNAYSLARQLDSSGRNAILLLPEVAFEQASGAIGKLANKDVFKAMIDETLGKVAAQVGGRASADIDRIVVASHSGGYTAAAAILSKGGLPVSEMWLLDSLYANDSDFDAWVLLDKDSERAPFRRRLASVYTAGGGTLDNSQAMAGRAATWFSNDASVILDDRSTATLVPDQYGHGLIFKRTALGHDEVPRYYFQKLLESSVLAERP